MTQRFQGHLAGLSKAQVSEKLARDCAGIKFDDKPMSVAPVRKRCAKLTPTKSLQQREFESYLKELKGEIV